MPRPAEIAKRAGEEEQAAASLKRLDETAKLKEFECEKQVQRRWEGRREAQHGLEGPIPTRFPQRTKL